MGAGRVVCVVVVVTGRITVKLHLKIQTYKTLLNYKFKFGSYSSLIPTLIYFSNMSSILNGQYVRETPDSGMVGLRN